MEGLVLFLEGVLLQAPVGQEDAVAVLDYGSAILIGAGGSPLWRHLSWDLYSGWHRRALAAGWRSLTSQGAAHVAR